MIKAKKQTPKKQEQKNCQRASMQNGAANIVPGGQWCSPQINNKGREPFPVTSWAESSGVSGPKSWDVLGAQQATPSAVRKSPCHKMNILNYVVKFVGIVWITMKKRGKRRVRRLMNVQGKQQRWLVWRRSSTTSSTMPRKHRRKNHGDGRRDRKSVV